jgi:hypothetical protein
MIKCGYLNRRWWFPLGMLQVNRRSRHEAPPRGERVSKRRVVEPAICLGRLTDNAEHLTPVHPVATRAQGADVRRAGATSIASISYLKPVAVLYLRMKRRLIPANMVAKP